MTQRKSLLEHVEAHLPDHQALFPHTEAVPIVERDEHFEEFDAGDGVTARRLVMMPGLDGVSVARHDAHQHALANLAQLEEHQQEISEARERLRVEGEEAQALIDTWYANNQHHLEHHGQHTFLGLDDPYQTIAEQQAELDRLRAELAATKDETTTEEGTD